MSREFTDAEKGTVQADWAETHSTLQILIEDALSGSQALTAPIPLHLATAEITVDGVPHTPWLSTQEAIGPIKQSLTEAVDRTSANIQNVDSNFGKDYVAQPEILQGALVKAGRQWRSLDGAGEVHRTLFTGIITQASANNRETRLQIIHDLEGLAAVGGDRSVTRTCAWQLQGKFRGTECGYAGAELACNGLFSHAGGCSGRSNQHRFGGFVKLEGKPDTTAAIGLGVPAYNQMVRLDSTYYTQRPFIQIDGALPSDDAANNRTRLKITSSPDDFIVNRHLYGGGSPPSISALGGAGGSSGRVLSVSGTNLCGTVEITPGTSPTAGPVGIVRVTYADAWPLAPIVILTPCNAAAAALGVRAFYNDDARDESFFEIWNGGAALTAGTLYVFQYHVMSY